MPTGEKEIRGSVTSTTSKIQSISAMEFYQSKSYEEIRLEDYISGRKGPVSFEYCGPKFQPPHGTDAVVRRGQTVVYDTIHRVITASREYSNESLEELRLEHYMPSIAWKGQHFLQGFLHRKQGYIFMISKF